MNERNYDEKVLHTICRGGTYKCNVYVNGLSGADIQSSANNVGLNQPGGKGAPAHSKVY